MVCACRKLLRDLSGVKPRIAYSLTPARVTSSACLRVRGVSLYDESRAKISARLQRTVYRPLKQVPELSHLFKLPSCLCSPFLSFIFTI